MLGILGNIKKYFRGSREHAVEFPGTGELYKSEFKGTSKLIFGEQGRNSIFSREQGNMPPPPPSRWEALLFEYSTTEVTLSSCLTVPSEHVASQSKWQVQM